MRTNDCPTCGQLSVSDDRPDERDLFVECRGPCESCIARSRGPQGETMWLFEPAPDVMPGQLGFD